MPCTNCRWRRPTRDFLIACPCRQPLIFIQLFLLQPASWRLNPFLLPTTWNSQTSKARHCTHSHNTKRTIEPKTVRMFANEAGLKITTLEPINRLFKCRLQVNFSTCNPSCVVGSIATKWEEIICFCVALRYKWSASSNHKANFVDEDRRNTSLMERH